ncbi:MAG: MBOAT family O-acyltransferase [Bacteroidota bacterium]
MLFNSFEYFIFFVFATVVYYCLRGQTARVAWLLFASAFFYMFFIPKFILILLVVILIDYFSGIAISKTQRAYHKKLFLSISITSNLLILFFFKYFNFFMDNLELISGNSFYKLNIILPIGLSFHTFQSLSYVIEVYRGNYKAEKRLDVFALYVLFFPQLVAGPIERPQNIIHQLKEFKALHYDNIIQGLKLITMGLIKKCIVADRIGVYVDGVYSNMDHSSPYQIMLAVCLFSIQIYFDFSGYSDIAIGSAKCLGIDLMKNFNLPYSSRSIKEFWTRWHISLSTWFKDYVFIPLGGSRVGKFKHFRNVMIVFSLSGLWHGASWNFVIWGMLHGVLVYLSFYVDWSFSKIKSYFWFLDVLYNFIIVSLLWVFFRSPDFETTITLFRRLIHFTSHNLTVFDNPNFGLFSFLLFLIGSTYLIYLNYAYRRSAKYDLLLLTVNFMLVFTFGLFSNQSFIYFQF